MLHSDDVGAPSADEQGGTLSPRRRLATPRAIIIVGLVAAAVFGFLVLNGLGNAALYFRTVDEAVAQRTDLGSDRFRIEGCVATEPVAVANEIGVVTFRIAGATSNVVVAHRGDPPELFRVGIPVVLEGKFNGERYDSDRIMVRHTEEYTEASSDNIDQAVQQCEANYKADA